MSDDPTDNESSDSEQVEWNVNQRSRRSTAGNRLSALLDQETPAADQEDDLQLLFIDEDGVPDEEFEDKDDDGDEDVAADDSSSSEDEDEGQDEMEGEHQLQREERAKKKQQKRKIEQAFMRPRASKPKRVKIAEPTHVAPTDEASLDAAKIAEQKKRKKSERVSWLLNTDEHGPVRTSSRTLSMQNKERTQASLKQSEAKRKRAIAVMEASDKRRQASQRKPLTQEEKLAEAAHTEELNSMSLNHWEEMERDRLEKQRAKLEALQNRRLEGPFIRWRSVKAEWEDGKLVHVGRRPKIEEIEDEDDGAEAEQEAETEAGPETKPAPESALEAETAGSSVANEALAMPKSAEDDQATNADPKPQEDVKMQDAPDMSMAADLHASNDADKAQLSAESAVAGSAAQASEVHVAAPMTPPSSEPPKENQGKSDTSTPAKPDSVTIDPHEQSLAAPQEQAAVTTVPGEDTTAEKGFLDGIDQYAAMQDDKDVESKAPAEGPQSASSPATEQSTGNDAATLLSAFQKPANPPAQQPEAPLEPEKPKETSYSSRQLVSLLNFSEPATASLDTYRRVLFDWRSSQLTKPVKHAAQLCAITSQPARYRDPTTGLAYRDIDALKHIKTITQEDGAGRPVWSQALGAWVGYEDAARGVPEGFLGKQSEAEDGGENVKREDGAASTSQS